MHENLTLFRQVERLGRAGGASRRLGNACSRNTGDGKIDAAKSGLTIGAHVARPDQVPVRNTSLRKTSEYTNSFTTISLTTILDR
jgi:hypothetical protein